MPSVRFEPAIPVIERRQTYALDRTTTGIGHSGLLRAHYFTALSASLNKLAYMCFPDTLKAKVRIIFIQGVCELICHTSGKLSLGQVTST
jgi:hypothetical protein